MLYSVLLLLLDTIASFIAPSPYRKLCDCKLCTITVLLLTFIAYYYYLLLIYYFYLLFLFIIFIRVMCHSLVMG